MKRSRHRKQRVRMWTLPEVEKIIPLVRSIAIGVRDHFIQGNAIAIRVDRLVKSGLDRTKMIEFESLKSQERSHDEAIMEAVEEILKLEAYISNPVEAEVGFPFVVMGMDAEIRQAWFLYASFEGNISWRFEEDGLKDRRDVKTLKVNPNVEIK